MDVKPFFSYSSAHWTVRVFNTAVEILGRGRQEGSPVGQRDGAQSRGNVDDTLEIAFLRKGMELGRHPVGSPDIDGAAFFNIISSRSRMVCSKAIVITS